MWFKRAVTLAPDDPSVRDQFGKYPRHDDSVFTIKILSYLSIHLFP